ncbi:MAG: hypothetical protein KAH67_08900 [Flavobacteriaceae bacterium]|nr:hypothetical protein [Flavobacteriaceae bacterium]
MNYSKFLIIVIVLITSCKKDDGIKNAFDCNTPSQFTNAKEYKDVLSKFKLKIPKYWKTNLYFDEFRSEIYSADTTKQLSETYIIDVTWHRGELRFDEEFEEKINENITKKGNLITLNSGYGRFKRHKSYFNLSVGENTDITYHYLQIFMKYNTDEYYTFTTKIYGEDFVSERICTSIQVFENIKFIK